MTAPEDSNATWLPNLVGGVSIWTLAADLNEPQFFDGRLLVPETEGAASLPVSVRWDLTNLLPLSEARSQYPDEVAAAVRDFEAALARVAKVFGTAGSGYDKYKDAFTVPSLEGGGASNYYYYAPASQKLMVVNWGASPRNVGGRAEYVFGWQDWGSVLRPGGGVAQASTAAGDGAATEAPRAVDAASAGGAAEGGDDAKAKPDDDGKKRPWWMLPLFVLAALAVLLLAFFLLRSCEDDAALPAADASSDANVDGAAAPDADASAETDADSSGDAQADSSGATAGDAAADASAADAATDAASDVDADAGKDGGRLSSDDGDDDDDSPGGGGGGGGSGGGAGGGGVIVVKGHAGGADGKTEAQVKSGPHRRHYQDGAVGWRVADGVDRVARTEQRGQRFDVWLGPDMTFQNVRVQWRDKSGQWHDH